MSIKGVNKASTNKERLSECRVTLAGSEYTYSLGGTKWIDTYTFAPDARITASRK